MHFRQPFLFAGIIPLPLPAIVFFKKASNPALIIYIEQSNLPGEGFSHLL
jgi:hypothetical protein